MSVTKVTGMMQTGTKGGDIPSASTLVIDTDGDYFDITGTTGITAMTVDAGRRFTLQFDGAVTLTHGSSLYLPGATNFTTEANDCLSFIATAANTVRCTGYALKDGGSPVAASAGLTLGTKQATTSGSSFTFSSIPSGTSLIFVNFDGVSLSGSSDNLLIRLGDAGGIETSGYTSTSTKIISGAHPSADTSSAGFLIRLIDDGLVTSGQMILTLFDAGTFTWVQSHTVLGSIYQPMIGGGKKALSAELTQLSLLTTGSDTFDAGSINISYQ